MPSPPNQVRKKKSDIMIGGESRLDWLDRELDLVERQKMDRARSFEGRTT